MPKAILEFMLPEEEQSFEIAVKGGLLHSIITDFDNDSLRKRIKYDENLPERDRKLIEELRKELWEIINASSCSELF